MKILFITGQSVNSNTSVTLMNLGYIKGLVELGHQVEIVTSEIPNNHISYDESIYDIKNIEIKSLPISKVYNNLSSKNTSNEMKIVSKFKRFLRRIYYSVSIYDTQKKWVDNAEKVELNCQSYDYIISSSDPKHSHLFAEKLISKGQVRYKKWIQIWGDPWALDITLKGKYLVKKIKQEEERLISIADKVFYVSPMTVEAQKNKYKKYSDKISLLPIAYFNTYEQESSIGKKNFSEVRFGYYGDYNSNIRELRPFYNTAVELNLNTNINGNSDLELGSINNVKVGPRVNLIKLKELEDSTDIFVHLSNNRGTQIPAKVFYYAASYKPILFILDGEKNILYNYFKKFNRFIFCENNVNSIKGAIKKIQKEGVENYEIKPLKEFSPKVVMRKMFEELEYDRKN